jgi:hypothetical protein
MVTFSSHIHLMKYLHMMGILLNASFFFPRKDLEKLENEGLDDSLSGASDGSLLFITCKKLYDLKFVFQPPILISLFGCESKI